VNVSDLSSVERTKMLEPGTEYPEYAQVSMERKSTKTTIPFIKNNEFDYAYLVGFLGDKAEKWSWIVLIIAVIFIVTAVSNGSNMTDGLDGLATSFGHYPEPPWGSRICQVILFIQLSEYHISQPVSW
jgi:hypothetical protein